MTTPRDTARMARALRELAALARQHERLKSGENAQRLAVALPRVDVH